MCRIRQLIFLMTTCAEFVQAWLAQFREVNDRATILVLWGPSRSGKTRFALSDIFGSNPLKVDVGDSEDLKMQAWDHRVHSHLVLDNVNSSAYIMRWRHVLMSPRSRAIGPKWDWHVCL